ncbi:RNA-guided endonuclease TnpB family protein [Streptomyces sp. NPDC002172]
MARFRMYPTSEQAGVMLGHCAHARYVWNLAVEQHAHWKPGRRSAPGFAEQCRQFRVTYRNGQWHIAFAVIPELTPAPGTGEAVGIDRGVTVTAALSDGRKLNCPQLTAKERAQIRKHERRAARAPKGSARKAAAYAKVASLKAREVNRRKDWCEKTSTMLARTYDVIRFEKLNIKNMTRSAKGTAERPGRNVRQKAGLSRSILAQGWGLLRQRTEHKAPGRVEGVPAPFTSLRCSACGWIEKKSRKSQADFVCVSCGFTCNADENAAINVAAGQGGIPRPRRSAGAGGVTAATGRSSAREPQPAWVGIPLF